MERRSWRLTAIERQGEAPKGFTIGQRIDRTSPQKQVVVFFLLAFALTWMNWVPRALASHGMIELAVPDFLGVVAGYGPALAAIISAGLFGGKAGLSDLGRRLVHWRVGWQWCAIALFLPAAISLTALALQWLLGWPPISADISSPPAGPSDAPLWQRALLLATMFIFGFDGLGEELGWRGFAVPKLQARFSALTASLILAACWAAWHLPYAMTKGSAMNGMPFWWFLPGMLASTILYTWIFNNTQGSILLAILFHAANNTTFNTLPILLPAISENGLWNGVVQGGVAIAVVIWGGFQDPGCDHGRVS